MEAKLEYIYSNRVWDLVEVLEGMRPIGCKWVYKRKKEVDGNVKTYKEKMVTNGYSKNLVLIMKRPSY